MLILLIIILIGMIIRLANRPRVIINITQEYWDGPKPTKAQQEQNLQRIFRIIEEHPNGVLATNNPEYVEEYLKRIDIDLPPGITGQRTD